MSETSPYPKPEIVLKDLSDIELLHNLTIQNWTHKEEDDMNAAYSLAAELHESDSHRAKPYTFHLLRVANRLVTHLGIHDSELAVAALLHDSVEDHADNLISILEFKPKADVDGLTPVNTKLQQELALQKISIYFSERTANIVRAVTNPPGLLSNYSYEAGIENYKNKVIGSITDPSAALLKFSDWCDNAVGIVHSELNNGRDDHFKLKYGGDLITAFENRFNQKDLQDLLSESALLYVKRQLSLARVRLSLKKN